MAITCTPVFKFDANKKGFTANVTYKITKVGKTPCNYSKDHTFTWKGTELWENLTDAGRKYYLTQLERSWAKDFKRHITTQASKSKMAFPDTVTSSQHKRFIERQFGSFIPSLNQKGEDLLDKVREKVLKQLEDTKKETVNAAIKTAKGVVDVVHGTKDVITGDLSAGTKVVKGLAKTANGMHKLQNVKTKVRRDGDDALVQAKKAITDAWTKFGKTEILINKMQIDSNQIRVQTETVVKHYEVKKLSDSDKKKKSKLISKAKDLDRTRAILQTENKADFEKLMKELDTMKTAVDSAMKRVTLHSKSILERLEGYVEKADELVEIVVSE